MILVTGATGFLGAELVSQLTAMGLRVRALRREQSKVPSFLQHNPLLDWVIADVNDTAALESAFEGIEQVYHCAAMVSFNPKDKEKLLKINIEGTANIVNLCLELGIRMLHVSSVAALGNPKKGATLITESDYWDYDLKSHSYAISKYEGEMEVWRGIAEGLDAVIVNPSVIIGPRSGYDGSGAIFKLIKDGLSYYTSGATGFVDVRDVAQSMISLMESKISEQRYILSAENYYYQDFFAAIAKGFSVTAPAKEAKSWMLAIAWRAAKLASFFTGKAPALTSDTARSSLNESLYNNEKIKKTIGITFKPLADSIAETCKALNNT